MSRRHRFAPPPWLIEALGSEHDDVLAERAGCSSITVYRMRKLRGIPPAPPKQRPSLAREAIAYAESTGVALVDAAEKFGVRASTAYQARSNGQMAEKLKPTSGDRSDTAVFRCKITEGRFIEMRLPTKNFTSADVERIRAFLITCTDTDDATP